ncbi:hypothetical protein HGA64_03545 [Candidatus Falkowbacteria bacterium]|nr:hypothetical protein [Candidatus Falkowbacteria bacterium]
MFTPTFEREVLQMRTKEEAQQELREKFGMPKTSDFQAALRNGQVEKAEEWLQYIIDHKDRFPQYHANWDGWVSDRRREIAEAKTNPGQEAIPTRSKEEAKKDLLDQFGFDDSGGFRTCLANGDVERAEKWLSYIEANPNDFPQYLATWSSWLRDRKKELERAKGK